MTDLIVTGLSCHAGRTPLVEAASFSLKQGELVVLLGPNGAGKTSLLRASLGITDRTAGSSELDGRDVRRLSSMDRARRIAYLPQQRPLAWPAIVRDIVALGRFSYGAGPGQLRAADEKAIDAAISACDLKHLSKRHADTLSGGELARVHIARALASEAPLLIADEPVASLDPRHQFRVMDTIKAYVQTGGGGLIVLHDISLAARYATRLIWMKDGRIQADGSPEATLTEQRLAEVYGVSARVVGRTIEMVGVV